jgi:hypothetical protein
MAKSKGQAMAEGHSPSGNFGSGGEHYLRGPYSVQDGGDKWLVNDNMHTVVTKTAGSV